MKNHPFQKKYLTSTKKIISIESFNGPLNLKGEVFYSMLKQSTPSTKEISRPEIIFETNHQRKGINNTLAENDALFSTDVLKTYIDICNFSYDNDPMVL